MTLDALVTTLLQLNPASDAGKRVSANIGNIRFP
jgi:hypothetical protein